MCQDCSTSCFQLFREEWCVTLRVDEDPPNYLSNRVSNQRNPLQIIFVGFSIEKNLICQSIFYFYIRIAGNSNGLMKSIVDLTFETYFTLEYISFVKTELPNLDVGLLNLAKKIQFDIFSTYLYHFAQVTFNSKKGYLLDLDKKRKQIHDHIFSIHMQL